MEQKIFKYPYYRASQFLTSQDLNESFSYVEEQERLTRAKMIGSGIISGLNFDSVNEANVLTEVTVNAGFGVTSDGFSVSYPKPVVYKYMVPFSEFISKEDDINTEKSFIKSFSGIKYLLYTAEEIDSKKFVLNTDLIKPISNIPQSEYEKLCLAIVAEQKTETSFNCNPSDCNINSSYKNIVYRPVLLDISSLEKINSYYPDLNYLQIQKLSHISDLKTVDRFNKKILSVLETDAKRIEDFLQQTTELVAGLLDKENVVLKKALKTFRQALSKDVSIYYLSFFNDLQAAINEFVNAYNNYIQKYAFSSASRTDLLLVLGVVPYVKNDSYRYTFAETAINEQFNADGEIVSKLYIRIAMLLENFIPSRELFSVIAHLTKLNFKFSRILAEDLDFEKIKAPKIKDVSKCIKIIPCKGYGEKLGNRSIPYYYDIINSRRSAKFLKSWHAHDLDASLDLIYNYYWSDLSAPENYETEFMLNLNDYPFYRIEGHLGLSIDPVYDYLSGLIKELDIPVQILKIDITNHAWNKFRDDFDLFKNKYKDFVQSVKVYKDNNPKNTVLSRVAKNLDKIKQDFTQTSYHNTGTVNKLLDDVNAYCNLILSNKAPANSSGNMVLDEKDVNFIKNKINEQKIFDLRDALAGLYKASDPIKEISLSEIKGLEYLAGVYKGGTFILLHDGQEVIGDFSLPYFYNFDKDRMI
ncbi:MAG TPA: hypothetical protein PKN48_05780 [Bacteroidales bacterium]|nr:hypothetical protein [Bacteroidales bacterium]